MHNEQGLITMWVGTNTDIHENKVAQENLQLTNTELKKINEDLDRFVYTASHDLKSPIINIGSLFQEIMHSAHFTDPDHEKMVQMFHNSLNQINNTITDLGEIAKVQKNEQSDIEEVDLQSLIDEITFSVQELIKSNQGRISTDFTGKSTLRFSRANLRSILYNLVSNGLKYRSPERQPLVYISTLTEGDYVILSVQDNGLGIDLDRHRDKLFQMFKRFHNHVPGTGLGLYIINRIMENNNGFVRVESNLNQGTTFRIYFRLRYK
jgi:signal transduction histidine kinase